MEQTLKQLARQMKALSNENRLALYLKILHHEHSALRLDKPCVCMISDIAAHFNLGAPTISHHIKVLEAAGLIEVHKHGKFISARINQDSHALAMRMFHVQPIDVS
ncbi:MAG: ArsR/SmtB family transcription factor [Formosimonas sp.]